MPGFRFGETDSFDKNWESFLSEMESADADMAAILRANKTQLSEIVRQGNRNPQARAEFNAKIMQALDEFLAAAAQKGGG
jgi:hypothetical protein